jgi:hypothetical protein
MKPELRHKIKYLNLAMVNETAIAVEVEPTLEAEIRKAQLEDEKLREIQQLIMENKTSDFIEDDNGTLWSGKRIAQKSVYSIHPGSTKMYRDLKTVYWWYGMMRDIVECISLCDTR